MARLSEEERLLVWVRIASELVAVAGSVYMVWRMMIPEDDKELLRAPMRSWWGRREAQRRERIDRAALVLDLMEITEACPHVIDREIRRLGGYDRRHDAPSVSRGESPGPAPEGGRRPEDRRG